MAQPSQSTAGAILTIDTRAAAANWRLLADKLAPSGAQAAAVVKADAYGLGVHKLAPAFWAEGCRSFYVATIDEGIALRDLLPAEASIAILNGPYAGTTALFVDHRLTPVLNAPEQVVQWASEAEGAPAIVHVDTGMSRLGLTRDETRLLADDPNLMGRLRIAMVMSHLACAEEADSELNPAQLDRFADLRAMLGNPPGSLANSSGIWLGEAWHAQQARPGASLYGVNPTPDRPNPMNDVIRLDGRIVQLREARPHDTVGYGATHVVPAEGGRVATVAVGYADGYFRHLSNVGVGYVNGHAAPLIGRVSMDLITFDVTGIPVDDCRPGGFIQLVGPENPVDFLAAKAGTIGYEVLTALGRRYHRVYL